jgi:hypothetical protein
MGLDNLINAQRNFDRELPDDLPAVELDRLTPTLAMNIADWVEQGGRERLLAVCDFLIDEFNLGDNDKGLDTLAHWVEEASGPRNVDFDYDRFDVQR